MEVALGEIMKQRKGEIELELATLGQILQELRKRGYRFIFVADCIYGKAKEGNCKIHFGTDDLVQPIRLAAEVFDMVLEILQKNNHNDAVTKTLTSILLQIDILFGQRGNSNETTNTEE